LEEETMNPHEAKIKTRLEEALNSIFCPVVGCWPLHGGHYTYYYDHDAEAHVLEVWPVGVEEKDQHGGNGHEQTERGLLYELAEFEFSEMVKEIRLEHFRFSQHRSLFEIGWKEDGLNLGLRVHIEPLEEDVV